MSLGLKKCPADVACAFCGLTNEKLRQLKNQPTASQIAVRYLVVDRVELPEIEAPLCRVCRIALRAHFITPALETNSLLHDKINAARNILEDT